MKILLTTDTWAPTVNGVVTSTMALRAELQACGHEVRVLTLAGSSHTYARDGVIGLGSLDAGLIYPGARLRAPALNGALYELAAWQPDIVHSQCEFSTFAPARRIAKACGVPLVHTYHTVYEDYTHYFSPSRRWGKALVRGFTRSIAARCDALFAPTDKVRDLLLGYDVSCPVFTLPTGIDVERFRVDRRDGMWLRDTLGIPQNRPVLLFLGRLAKEKNLDALLDVAAAVPGATLLVAGDGPDGARFRAEAESRGLDVVFGGMVDPAEVPVWYAAADIFLSASTSETQGLTYLEALAAGLPVICRADPCLKGVVRGGVNGYQCADAAEMAARTAALLAAPDELAAMGRRAKASAQAFSEENFARRAAALYREQILLHGAAPALERRAVWTA